MSLDCTRNRQIVSLLSPAFRDLMFPISLLTDSLIILFIVGAVGGCKINVSGVTDFPPLSLPLPFPRKKKILIAG